MIKNLPEIEKALGLTPGQFKTMYDDTAEVVLDVTPFEIVKKTDLETRINNIKETTKVAAVEMAVKEARTSLGLDFQGKTIDKLTEAYKAKVIADANIPADARVKELEKDFGAMKMNFETATTKLQQVEGDYKKKEQERSVNDLIMSKIPSNTTLPKEDLLVLFKTKNQLEYTETGGIVFKKDGETLKNPTTLSPKTVEEVMVDFITPYAKAPEGGGGGKDAPGQAKAGTFQAFAEEMDKAGIKENTSKYNQEMSDRIKAKTLVM